ncbi:hypothetical protein [Pseudomonas atacamensis]|uniref:hypothetical protein n=1 Tax=Pseudomonas atacamensis TaxID=2565368 RepID=UPI0037FB1F10
MSVQVHSTEANAALALYPVYPPQWITPVLPKGTADGGLPLSAFTPSGVELVIDPITGLRNWVMAAYDVVTIFVNGVSTGISKTIYPGEEQERILLHVPASWFTNGVNDVRYRVTRVGGNNADSPTLKLLYNNPAPTVTVSHPPSVAPGQTAVIAITVGYPRPHDTVKLTIGIWSITFANPTSPINQTLTAAELQLIGDGTHSVFATVHDQLTNNSESAKTPITITANQKVYNAPIIAEAVDGALDVAALKGQDATLRARDWTGIQIGQQVWLKLTGQKSDGSAHVLQFWNGDTHKVNATWESQGFWDKPLLIAFLKELKEGSLLKLEFWVSEDKSNDFASATRFPDQVYTVTGLQLDLPPPTLTPPTVPIDVLANPDGVKLQIKDFAAEKDDKAQFVQVNAQAGAPPFPVVDFVGEIAEILLSAAFLAAWHGKAIEFRWDLIRNGEQAGRSAILQLEVLALKDGLENWESEQPMTFHVNNPVKFKSGLTFNILVSNNGWITKLVKSDDSALGNLSLLFGAYTSARFSLSFAAKNIELSFRHIDQPDNKITFLDQHLAPLSTIDLPETSGTRIFEFTAQGLQRAHYFEISSTEAIGHDAGFYIDNIKWKA